MPLSGGGEDSLEMVFLKGKDVMSANRGLDSHRWRPIRRRHAVDPEGEVGGGLREKEKTNVCVLSFDTGGGYDPGLLLVLVKDVRICIDIAVDDLEPGLVGDAISVSERGRAGIWVARHDMEWGGDEGRDGAGGVGGWG